MKKRHEQANHLTPVPGIWKEWCCGVLEDPTHPG